jgi:hypothetical protein
MPGFDARKGREGIQLIFQMMNEARLGVGLQGFALGNVAYLYALRYAKERIQGVKVEHLKDPSAPRIPIIKHPDVRRMLIPLKAYAEGAKHGGRHPPGEPKCPGHPRRRLFGGREISFRKPNPPFNASKAEISQPLFLTLGGERGSVFFGGRVRIPTGWDLRFIHEASPLSFADDLLLGGRRHI